MTFWTRLRKISRSLVLIAFSLLALTHAASGQGKYIVGEVVVLCQPGTPKADVDALAQKVQADSVVPLLMQDCYKFVLPAAKKTENDTLGAVATLKMDARVRHVSTNDRPIFLQSGVTPNDPLYGKQWGLKNINAPLAWTITTGGPNANVAVIDNGFNPDHEDMVGRYHSGSMSFVAGDAPSAITYTGTDFPHGGFVSSIVGATANNAKGMTGICWSGMQIIGLKFDSYDGVINAYSYLYTNRDKFNLKAVNMSYGFDQDPNDTTNQQYILTKQLADAGIVMVAAGEETGKTFGVPNGYAHVIHVSALGPSNNLSSYNVITPGVDLSAPGGDSQKANDDVNGMLGAYGDATTYMYADGTSFAAPHVTAVAGLLMSLPGMTAARAIQALYDNANRDGLSTIPDTNYGYGRLDAYKTLKAVAISAKIQKPFGTDANGNSTDPNGPPAPIETFKPRISVELDSIPMDPGADKANVQFVIDKGTASQVSFTAKDVLATPPSPSAVSDASITFLATGTSERSVLSFRYAFPPSPGSHTLDLTASNAAAAVTVTDHLTFSILPHNISTGLSLISIPYYEPLANNTYRQADSLLGTGVKLYRFKPVTTSVNSYITYLQSAPTSLPGGAIADDYQALSNAFQVASDLAPTVGINVSGQTVQQARPPIGLGFFARTDTPIPVATYGEPVTDDPTVSNASVNIPLHEGWNLIGDPFPFAVSFRSSQIQTRTGERLAIEAAAGQNLLKPFIYRYIGGEYTFRALPDGLFVPWEGHWIYVTPADPKNPSASKVLTLIVPPTETITNTGTGRGAARLTRAITTPTTTASSYKPGVSGLGSWSLRLVANTGSLTDSYNFVGMSQNGTDAEDNTKAPKPPKPAPYVSLAINRSATPRVQYAQDIRPLGGVRTWNLSVTTDQANADVNLSWPEVGSVPRSYRLTLTDETTHQAIDLRNRSSYSFHSSAVGQTRAFTLTARPSVRGGATLITNIVVNPSRPADSRSPAIYEIGYTASQDAQVEVSILTFGGRALAQLSPGRAVSAGDNRIVWNGRDSAGRALPAGSYVLQFRAHTSDGYVSRETRPLIVTGR